MPSRKKLANRTSGRRRGRPIDRLAAKMLGILNAQGATLDIFLLPHREMKALKRRFIKKQTEPNVLSFPEPRAFPHPETKKRYLGEVYLNENILAASPERAAPLLLHGILHLLGHDHVKSEREARAMEGLEGRILKKLVRPHARLRSRTRS